MIDMNNTNPIIGDPSMVSVIQFAQTRDTLMDTEIYSKFIYSAENSFRRSRFYKDYKANIMNRGLNFDELIRGITSEQADIDLHHHLPTLNMASIMICEHLLNTVGKVTTFDIVEALEEAHRCNMINVIMLSETMHQAYHQDATAFLSITQGYGNPFLFLDKYKDGLTLDISFKWLLQLKLEEQFGNKSTWLNIPKQREILLNWQENAGPINY